MIYKLPHIINEEINNKIDDGDFDPQIEDTTLQNTPQNIINNVINNKREETRNQLIIQPKKNEFTNLIKADLNKVTTFRNTLESKEERWNEQIKVLDLFDEDSPEYYSYIEEIKDDLRAKTDYDMMVELIDQYIKDLKNMTFKMANRQRYIHTDPKPNLSELQDYLIVICKKLDIKGVNNVKSLIRKLNKIFKEN